MGLHSSAVVVDVLAKLEVDVDVLPLELGSMGSTEISGRVRYSQVILKTLVFFH